MTRLVHCRRSFEKPLSAFIDAEGYAIARANGAIDQETLQKGIEMIRGE